MRTSDALNEKVQELKRKYFIGNLNVYTMALPASVNYGTLVCEVIEKENREKQEEVDLCD